MGKDGLMLVHLKFTRAQWKAEPFNLQGPAGQRRRKGMVNLNRAVWGTPSSIAGSNRQVRA